MSETIPALSVMFFASADGTADRYAMVREMASVADRLGYEAVWLPERHFDAFGGPFPNPSVLAAAVATITDRCHIRAGSVVAPLHDVLRIAEEWAVVDHLAGPGRIGISIGSGWNTNDFVFAPDRYEDRAEVCRLAVEQLRSLWAGEPLRRVNGSGRTVPVLPRPRPASDTLPLWLTASGNPATFEAAGSLGTGVLTHLLGQSLDQLREKINRYRSSRAQAGHDGPGRVTLMLHTAITDADLGSYGGYPPLREYLHSALRLELRAAAGGGSVSGGRTVDVPEIPDAMLGELLDERTRRFCAEASLIGSVEDSRRMLERAAEAGVDEVACLVDFGPDRGEVAATLATLGKAFLPSTLVSA